MNIKVVEYSIFVLSVTVIYLIVVCRDLQHTNELQDTALDELTTSIPLLVRNNIDSYHRNNHDQINTENENLNSESVYKKGDNTMKEDLVKKSMDVNTGVPRKAFHNNYKKHRHGRDVSMIPSYDYRKSFHAAHRIKNSNKETMKKMWTKKRSFRNKRHEAMKSKEPVKDNNWESLKQNQKQDFQERKDQQHKNLESRKLMDNMLATTTSCTLTTASFFGFGFSFSYTLQHPDHNNNTSASFNLSVDVMTDDYTYDVAMGWTLFQKESYDLIIDSDDDYFTSEFYANTTHVFEYYCVVSYGEMNETIDDDMVPTCFEFVVHNSQTDEMLHDFGSSINITMSINNNEKATVTDQGKNKTSMNASFCFDSDNDNVFNHEPFNTVIMLENDNNYNTETEENNDSNISSPVLENDDSSSDGLIDNDDHDDYNISTNTTYINDDMISTENDGNNNDMVDDDDYNNINNSVIADDFGYDNISTNATYSIDDKVLSSGMTDDYDYYFYNKTPESSTNENDLYLTSCVLTKAEVTYACYDNAYTCSDKALDGKCTNTSIYPSDYVNVTWQDWMIEICPKSCDACVPSESLFENQVQHEEDDNNATTFNLQLNVTADSYAHETSWTFLSQNKEDSIFDSSEVNITSELKDRAEYKFNYYCIVHPTEENHLTDDNASTCYNFEVRDSWGDGAGFFSLGLSSMNNKTLVVSNEFEDGSVMSTSFCIDHDDGDIESSTGIFIIEEEEKPAETTDTNPYHMSCVVTKAEIIPTCDDYGYVPCSDLASRCTDTSDFPYDYDYVNVTWQEIMLEYCQKTCDACVPSELLFDYQVQHEEYDNSATTFNLQLNVTTDIFAYETSWTFLVQNNEDSIFDSSEVNITSQLKNNTEYKINYYCTVHPTEENQLTDDTASTCYNFEVHDSYGNGGGFFSLGLSSMNNKTLVVSNEFEDGSVMSTSFCIDHDDGDIESSTGIFIIDDKEVSDYLNDYPFPTPTEQQTHSHFPFNWQCKNEVCLCDSKPSLTSNIHENLAFMLEVAMLSDSDKLHDVESAQYKAACWVLYDDPFEYDLVEERIHKRMVQRYILAMLYFATSPEKWEEHYDFLSSRSECDWNDIDDFDNQHGISCNEDDNVISIYLSYNDLDGTIVEELSGLRMLEELSLYSLNKIRGTISSVLGRLSELRVLNLGGNLEGTIPPQLFNLSNLEELDLGGNRLEGTIPEKIGSLQKLWRLSLSWNNLSGSIPEAMYSLKNLEKLWLERNKLSSSISTLIGNLNKLEELSLSDNMLTGQIPSKIGSLSSLNVLFLYNNRLSGSIPSTIGNMKLLEQLYFSNNTFSGPIPESLFDLPELKLLGLQDNSVTGSVPDEFCEKSDDYDYFAIEADCRNNVFDPEVSCSCCKYCKDESPIWDGECDDATVKVVIDHGSEDSAFSWNLTWSLTNDATGKKVLFDGPYAPGIRGLQSYEVCVAYSDCFSFNQISPPYGDTNYTLYWNDNSIHNGTFQGFIDNFDINRNVPPKTILSFSHNEGDQQLASCYEIKLKCYKEEQPLLLEPNTTKRIMYDQAIKTSGRSTIHDTSSPQSKALCWMLSNNNFSNKIAFSDTEFIQRYVLAILHFMSQGGLFVDYDYEYPPVTHECDWNGITCKDYNTKIVTGISLSSEDSQIIKGTLMNEIGSLKYLEVLELSQTQLQGTIPRSFSNLWSLTKLDLSGNEISSTIPATLFRQLNKLEYIDLSNNKLRGSINQDIGSFSRIRSLSLNENELTGSLPLEGFKHYDLEHLDVSSNGLSEIDFSLLLKHNNLKFLDVSSNFFVGSLLDHTFTSLTQLRHFNISQNDFSGTIPSTFPVISNITHIDIHSNRFKGVIPLSISELKNIQHINLQGNKLTGSLPSQLNQLKSLNALILSHNELKGSMPFDPKTLQNMEMLHLHSNKLSGKAPEFKDLTSYISDCGFPSDSLEPVSCSTCNTCCNSDGVCQSKTSKNLSQVEISAIFVVSIIVFILICYLMKDHITSNKCLESFFSETVFYWNAMVLISDKSVYHFLLAKNKTEWFVAVCCVVFQSATLFLFVHSADLANEISDREYTMTCPAKSLECENSNTVSSYGLFVFGLILTIWLLKDIIGSIKLMLVSFQKRSIDFFFAGALVFTVTMLSIWTSVIYIIAIAAKDTDMIKDAVVLLFVVEVDERIFQLVESINPDWIKAIDNNMRQSLIYGGDDLVITSWAQKSAKSMESMRKKLGERYESFRMRSSRGSVEREVE